MSLTDTITKTLVPIHREGWPFVAIAGAAIAPNPQIVRIRRIRRAVLVIPVPPCAGCFLSGGPCCYCDSMTRRTPPRPACGRILRFDLMNVSVALTFL